MPRKNHMLSIPAMIYIASCFLGLYIALGKHGKEVKFVYDARPALVASLFIWALLWWGGFFALH